MKFTDQIGCHIQLKTPPKRIVSLVPSQTELLANLGLTNEVIGITKFCIYPKSWFKNKEKVGGTKTVNINTIKQLKPDLIIANKEENTQLQIEILQNHFPVWTSNIANLEDAKNMILAIGEMTHKELNAKKIVSKITEAFSKLSVVIENKKNKKLIYLIWKKPFMSISKNTFIADMLKKCGFINAIDTKNNYPEISLAQIKTINPDLIFLSSEPFPFKTKHKNELIEKGITAKIIFVNGEMFSWYGSRLQLAPKYFVDLINEISIKKIN